MFWRRKKKNKKSSFTFKLIKIFGGVLIVLLMLFMYLEDDLFIILRSKENQRKEENWKDAVTIGSERPDYTVNLEESKETSSGNGNSLGTKSGLNLLLIDQISTDGYVKDFLSLYRDASQGKFDNSQYQLSLTGMLGIQYNETGVYSLNNGNIPILKSYLPVKGNKIVYNEEFSGVPAEAMKVSKFNGAYKHIVANSNGNTFPTNGKYFGPFQIDQGMFRSLEPASINGHGQPSGRPWDIYFQADSLTYINNRLSKTFTQYMDAGGETPDGDFMTMLSSGAHNTGEIGFIFPATFGIAWGGNGGRVAPVDDNKVDRYKYLKLVAEDFKEISKHINITGKLPSHSTSRVLVAYGLIRQGWKLDDEGYQYLTGGNYVTKSGLEDASLIIYGKKDRARLLEEFKQAHQPLPMSSEEAKKVYGAPSNTLLDTQFSGRKGHIYILRDEKCSNYKNKMSDGTDPKLLQYVQLETAGQIFNAIYTGPYLYASMLKFAGVGVDPSNPDSYFTQMQEENPDEYIPKGTLGAYKEQGVETSGLSSKRKAVLSAASKYIGYPYVWGGNMNIISKEQIPKWIRQFGRYTDSGVDRYGHLYQYDGKDMIGMDCADFTYQAIKEGMGLDITHYTTSQATSSLTYKIDPKDALPGDLVISHAHVGFYMKPNPNGNTKAPVVLHAPKPQDFIKFGVSNFGYGGYLGYYRIKGIDD